METRISQRPSRIPGRRSRAPGARWSSQAPLKPAEARAFGRALDLLVRAIRMSSPSLDQAATRAFAAWRGVNLLPLEIDAVEVRVRGVGVTATEHEIRWALPAFMAGLRRVTPHPELSEMELRNLAEALAHIDPNVASIEVFRDWIWSGAATGFDLEIQSSFMEVLDDAAMEREVEVSESLSQMQAAVMRTSAERAELLSTRTLARLADRDELDLPLCASDTCAQDPPFALPIDVSARLRARCDDPAMWIAAELGLVTSQPALADMVRVDHFARRLRDTLRRSSGGALIALEALAQRARLRDPFALELLKALDDTSFGVELGEVLWIDPEQSRRAVDVVLALGPAAAHASMGVLLARASTDEAWGAVMKSAVIAAGGRLDGALLERAEVPGASEVLALVECFGAAGLQTLWARARHEGAPWLGRPFAMLCRAMLDAGAGGTLVQAARDRAVSADLRVEILDVLGADPSRLAEAVAWRVGELLEPLEMRDRLKRLRAKA